MRLKKLRQWRGGIDTVDYNAKKRSSLALKLKNALDKYEVEKLVSEK